MLVSSVVLSFSAAVHCWQYDGFLVGRRRARGCLLSQTRKTESLTDAQSPKSLSHQEIERYSRHLILEEVGMSGQLKLKSASVLCVGAGGLGSPAIMYLAAAGVGRITICDDDVVDYSNLQRQIVHDTALVGSPKTSSAAASVKRINPFVQVNEIQARLGPTLEDAVDMIKGHDVVVDGSDNFQTKFLVDEACIQAGVPNVYAAILRFEGQASVFNYPPGSGTSYRDLLPSAPPPGAVPSCAEGGVLGVLCGVLGAIQATEAIKIILDQPPHLTLANRVLVYDAKTMTFRQIPLAAKAHRDQDEDETAILQKPKQNLQTLLDAQTTAQKLADGWNPYVLDVRLPQEAEISALPFTDGLCPHRQVHTVADKLPRDRDLLLFCKSGFRSRIACETLAELGFSRLYHLDGGILAWSDQVDPRLPKY